MEKVTGTVEVHVWVYCPECGETVDLDQIADNERRLGVALFGGAEKLAQWDNIGAVYECPECGKEFELDSFET
ncbi:MAG: hypothetical protein HN580_05370 [Deltaproteobacteria bacterium]|jgi:predicted RNA-binding Zn-ribbon protein involved in translation (DUF1610 family)|nr:hypothetical protein [Deltaproteobacteria bacterium]MBT6069032.1 hypothetical protein [Candidatus Peregrinibacteria bacterium]MBT4265691.1 hypothetical protein [Deltaproteobacteria bacterium]MBT4637700.1 hypothetical protein [Deltaproteobacteria bacterium]MBT6502227.1 hypothetical protein [Deltaproteobacteria bacterium]